MIANLSRLLRRSSPASLRGGGRCHGRIHEPFLQLQLPVRGKTSSAAATPPPPSGRPVTFHLCPPPEGQTVRGDPVLAVRHPRQGEQELHGGGEVPQRYRPSFAHVGVVGEALTPLSSAATNLTAGTVYEVAVWAHTLIGDSPTALSLHRTGGVQPERPLLKTRALNQTAVECSWTVGGASARTYGVFYATSFLDLYRSPRQVVTASLGLTVVVDSGEQYLFLVRF